MGNKLQEGFLTVLLLFLFTTTFQISEVLFDPVYYGWLINLSYIFLIFYFVFFGFISKLKSEEFMYVLTMLVGMFFLLFSGRLINPINEAVKWMVIPIILIVIMDTKLRLPLTFFILLIILLHWGIAIYEGFNKEHFFIYYYAEDFDIGEDETQFRSFGLTKHPLMGANLTTIALASILVSKRFKIIFKLLFLSIGSTALIFFNSRAALILWIAVLLIFVVGQLSKTKFLFRLVFLVFTPFFLMLLFSWEQIYNLPLGRIIEGDLIDENSLTRVISFIIFFKHEWSIQEIFFGGEYLKITALNLYLENGFLLNLCWWGWIIGGLKSILEVLISWKIVLWCKVNLTNGVLLIVSTWLVAFSNNNSISPSIFIFSIFCSVYLVPEISFKNIYIS